VLRVGVPHHFRQLFGTASSPLHRTLAPLFGARPGDVFRPRPAMTAKGTPLIVGTSTTPIAEYVRSPRFLLQAPTPSRALSGAIEPAVADTSCRPIRARYSGHL
jgi:hypothetical protein